MQALIADRLEEIAELCRKHHVKRLTLFGSAARDDFDPKRSDVDLLVKFDESDMPKLVLRTWYDLGSKLEKLLGRDVDLQFEGPIRNPVLRRHIEADKVVLYAA